jgi:putative acetyltransferase
MIDIRKIKPDQVQDARLLIYTVAHGLFYPDRPMEEVIARWDAEGILSNLEDIPANYFNSGGTFLVMEEGESLIGTGAFRRINGEVCELKRLWFLPEIQGKGLGYQMVKRLFALAREKGYRKIRLETDPMRQSRALAFYRRLGFYKIPCYGSDLDNISLERSLEDE